MNTKIECQLGSSTTLTTIPNRKSSFRRAYEACDRMVQHYFNEETASNDNTGTVSTSSPVNKRRGFSGRKWLPPPLRKLSQGKVDKAQNNSALERPPLKKTGSDKRIKIPSDMGNKPSVSEGEEDEERSQMSLKGAKSLGPDLANGGGEDVDEEVELPPPMKPIQEPILVTSPPSGVPDIEENSCKREQHSENQERHSLRRNTKSSDAIVDFDNSHQSIESSGAVGVVERGGGGGGSIAFSGDESDTTKPTDEVDEVKRIENLLKKRHFVLQELIETEEAYVRDLALIVDGYILTMKDPDCEIPIPEDLKDGKDKMVFGNIEAIYDWHKDIFLKTLKKSINNPTDLAQLFRKYERKLHMYVVYCKNKPVSEYIVSEYLDTYFEELRVKLGHKLQLCDLLIKPVQRIMKYQLMLKDILKYTERAGLNNEAEALRAAYEIMVIVPKAANDMMDVGRLQGFDGKITSQGKLLLHGLLNCSDVQGTVIGKNKDLQVFLFEQSIILSEVVGKKTQFTSPQYIYKAHIQVNKMNLDVGEDCFILRSTDPNKPAIGFICQTTTPELHEQWLSTIRNILQTQKDFLKAIQSPIAYQKELTKEASLPDSSALWDPCPLRKTVSVPSTSPAENNKQQQQRKTAQYIHKANTIGIPSENDFIGDNHHENRTFINNNNHTKMRLHFLEGFKNTLRSKHKSDPAVLETNQSSSSSTSSFTSSSSSSVITPNKEEQRRWSETNHSPTVL